MSKAQVKNTCIRYVNSYKSHTKINVLITYSFELLVQLGKNNKMKYMTSVYLSLVYDYVIEEKLYNSSDFWRLTPAYICSLVL